MWKIPLSDISFDEREIEAVVSVLRSKWLTMGEVTQTFERAFADLVGVPHAFGVTNCTVALQLAYRVLGVKAGDEVLMPSLTFVASANAAVAEGGTPVFVDLISEDDLTISPEDLRAKITKRTKVITVVHYAGYPCDMDAICGIAREHGLAIVEDCAHSPGATYGGRQTGSIGDVGCFSFFSNKNMTTGEGGMITTKRADLAEHISLLRSHGMTSLTLDRHQGHSFSYDVLNAGYNFRLDEMRSALGLVQLSKLEEANRRRGEITRFYRAAFSDLVDEGLIRLPFSDREERAAYHILPILLSPELSRKDFMDQMRNAGVQTSIHYPPIHKFSYYAKALRNKALDLPGTEAVCERLVTLPLYPDMTPEDVDYVVATARQIVAMSRPTNTANRET
ncbi:MAG: DegT/DnrJ/EryC1/StrS family aminotransferase [Pyrinomonadaceae bacterium]